MKSPKTHVPNETPAFLLVRAANAWRREAEARLTPHGLSYPQFQALACTEWLTRENRPASQADVARAMHTDANTASQLLAGLEKKGLVERKRGSEDDRAKRPKLTPAGEKLLAKAAADMETTAEKFFAPLEDKQDRWQKLVRRLLADAEGGKDPV